MAGKANRRGFGYTRKLPSKRWQASYTGPDLARYAAPSTFAAKVDAELWLASERALIAAGKWSPPALRRDAASESVTFGVYARTWLRDRRLKPRTREGYEHLMRRYLLDDFGDLPLPSITPASVRAWWGQLDEATPTVNARAYSLLKAIMNTAVADEEIVANPCRIRSATSVPRAREIRPASIGELSVIVANLPENRRAIALLCSWCAMRIGEVLELRRKDVDLAKKVVRVERSVAWVGGKPVVGSPKSAAGRRAVSIPPHVVPALKEHLDQLGLLKVWLTPDLWGREVPAGRMSTCQLPTPESSVRTSSLSPDVARRRSRRWPGTSGSPSRVCGTGFVRPTSRTATGRACPRQRTTSCARPRRRSGSWSRRTRSYAELRRTCPRPT